MLFVVGLSLLWFCIYGHRSYCFYYIPQPLLSCRNCQINDNNNNNTREASRRTSYYTFRCTYTWQMSVLHLTKWCVWKCFNAYFKLECCIQFHAIPILVCFLLILGSFPYFGFLPSHLHGCFNWYVQIIQVLATQMKMLKITNFNEFCNATATINMIESKKVRHIQV